MKILLKCLIYYLDNKYIMASTNMKNATGYYCEQHKRFNKISNCQTDSIISKHKDNCLPDLGIINGMMTTGYNNNILSNNAADIESSLFGIGSTNLVEMKPDINPSLNKLKHCKWFPRNNVFLPKPLVIEKSQRVSGPFSS